MPGTKRQKTAAIDLLTPGSIAGFDSSEKIFIRKPMEASGLQNRANYFENKYCKRKASGPYLLKLAKASGTITQKIKINMNQAILFNAGLSFEEVQGMKQSNVLLQHKSGVKFQYICSYQPQFSSQRFVKLFNWKSGKSESFLASTYRQFFKIIEQ